MKFGDVVIAVASLAVILLVIEVPLGVVLIPALGFEWGPTVYSAVSILLSALIVGYIFAGKISEARMEAIAKILVLGAVLWMLFLINYSSYADWAPTVKEAYQTAHPETTLSTYEWVIVESMALSQMMFINVVMGLVLAFIGLYAGSMLRRPVKSGK